MNGRSHIRLMQSRGGLSRGINGGRGRPPVELQPRHCMKFMAHQTNADRFSTPGCATRHVQFFIPSPLRWASFASACFLFMHPAFVRAIRSTSRHPPSLSHFLRLGCNTRSVQAATCPACPIHYIRTTHACRVWCGQQGSKTRATAGEVRRRL